MAVCTLKLKTVKTRTGEYKTPKFHFSHQCARHILGTHVFAWQKKRQEKKNGMAGHREQRQC